MENVVDSNFIIQLADEIFLIPTSFAGYTFNINDAVMGITFLAVGGSIPEASSAIVNARNGLYFLNTYTHLNSFI